MTTKSLSNPYEIGRYSLYETKRTSWIFELSLRGKLGLEMVVIKFKHFLDNKVPLLLNYSLQRVKENGNKENS